MGPSCTAVAGWMHRQRFSVGLPTVFGEDWTPLGLMACRTSEGVALEAKDSHGVVPDYFINIISASHALQRIARHRPQRRTKRPSPL
jgi:hypothetical protein